CSEGVPARGQRGWERGPGTAQSPERKAHQQQIAGLEPCGGRNSHRSSRRSRRFDQSTFRAELNRHSTLAQKGTDKSAALVPAETTFSPSRSPAVSERL